MKAEGLIGHRAVMARLSELAAGGRLPHAVLLTGPPGVGKSIAARALAAAHLCAKSGCGECSVCRRVATGSHPDFHLLTTEEDRRDIRIDPTRALMAALALRTYEGAGTAAVIDPADRMNEESQNAFLKTLEEPPPGTLLILVSSRPEGLAATVRSRCQAFRFGRLSAAEMDEFVAAQSAETDASVGPMPVELAAGCPGRLAALREAGAGRIRDLAIQFLTSCRTPSSVAFARDVMAWAKEAPNQQAVRGRVKIFLEVAMLLIRDLIVLAEGAGANGGEPRSAPAAAPAEGAPDVPLCNPDAAGALKMVLPLYDSAALMYSMDDMTEFYADVECYVDPGLVVETAALKIRGARVRRGGGN